MHLMTTVVENLVKPAVLRGLLAWERRESGVAYDFTSEEVRTDPYDTYRRLRSLDPVHRMRTIDAWALTRYRDVEAVLRDHARFANADRVFVETIPMSLLELDPPEHTRLRLLVSKAFTPKAVGDAARADSTDHRRAAGRRRREWTGSTWWRRSATRCRSP